MFGPAHQESVILTDLHRQRYVVSILVLIMNFIMINQSDEECSISLMRCAFAVSSVYWYLCVCHHPPYLPCLVSRVGAVHVSMLKFSSMFCLGYAVFTPHKLDGQCSRPFNNIFSVVWMKKTVPRMMRNMTRRGRQRLVKIYHRVAYLRVCCTYVNRGWHCSATSRSPRRLTEESTFD